MRATKGELKYAVAALTCDHIPPFKAFNPSDYADQQSKNTAKVSSSASASSHPSSVISVDRYNATSMEILKLLLAQYTDLRVNLEGIAEDLSGAVRENSRRLRNGDEVSLSGTFHCNCVLRSLYIRLFTYSRVHLDVDLNVSTSSFAPLLLVALLLAEEFLSRSDQQMAGADTS